MWHKVQTLCTKDTNKSKWNISFPPKEAHMSKDSKTHVCRKPSDLEKLFQDWQTLIVGFAAFRRTFVSMSARCGGGGPWPARPARSAGARLSAAAPPLLPSPSPCPSNCSSLVSDGTFSVFWKSCVWIPEFVFLPENVRSQDPIIFVAEKSSVSRPEPFFRKKLGLKDVNIFLFILFVNTFKKQLRLKTQTSLRGKAWP